MLKFISASVLLFALTATGFVQEAKKQMKPEPIAPEGEKLPIAQGNKKMKNDGIPVTPRDIRLGLTINGQVYRVKELMLARSGLAKEAKQQKKPEPIVPEGEKLFVADAAIEGFSFNATRIVQTQKGPRLEALLNKQIYHVTELRFKIPEGGPIVTISVENGQVKVSFPQN